SSVGAPRMIRGLDSNARRSAYIPEGAAWNRLRPQALDRHVKRPIQATRSNIERIVRLEEQAEKRQSALARVGERIGAFAGTLTFVGIHMMLAVVWVLINRGMMSQHFILDPS